MSTPAKVGRPKGTRVAPCVCGWRVTGKGKSAMCVCGRRVMFKERRARPKTKKGTVAA